MHKPDQGRLQLDQSQLPYPKNLGLVWQEAVQPNITKSPTITCSNEYANSPASLVSGSDDDVSSHDNESFASLWYTFVHRDKKVIWGMQWGFWCMFGLSKSLMIFYIYLIYILRDVVAICLRGFSPLWWNCCDKLILCYTLFSLVIWLCHNWICM